MKQYYILTVDSMDAEKGLEPEEIYHQIWRLQIGPQRYLRHIAVREVSRWPSMVGLLLGMARLAGTKAIEPLKIKRDVKIKASLKVKVKR